MLRQAMSARTKWAGNRSSHINTRKQGADTSGRLVDEAVLPEAQSLDELGAVCAEPACNLSCGHTGREETLARVRMRDKEMGRGRGQRKITENELILFCDELKTDIPKHAYGFHAQWLHRQQHENSSRSSRGYSKQQQQQKRRKLH